MIVVCFDRSQKSSTPSPHIIDDQRNLSIDQEIEVIRVTPYGESLRSGAPDELSASPIRSLWGLGINTLRLRAAYRDLLRSLSSLTTGDSKIDSLTDESPVVIAHWAIPCAWIAYRQRPLVYCHGGDIALLESLPIGKYLRKVLAKRLFALGRGVVCVSEDLERRVRQLIDPSTRFTPMKTLPMGVSLPNPCPQYVEYLRSLISRDDLLIFSTVGRIVKIKGYDLLLDALLPCLKRNGNGLYG